MQNHKPVTIHDLRRALQLPQFDAWSAQMKMTPPGRESHRLPEKSGDPRLGGVLALFFPTQGELRVVLTRRRDDLKSHAGQMSFPGGKQEPDESLLMTALRETEEEIGIPAHTVEIVGQLTPLYIPPTDIEVHPFVAWYDNGSPPKFTPNPAEVAEIVEVPLRQLLDPASRQEQPWTLRGRQINVPYYAVAGHKVWGATAMMISELLERLRVSRSQTLGI